MKTITIAVLILIALTLSGCKNPFGPSSNDNYLYPPPLWESPPNLRDANPMRV